MLGGEWRDAAVSDPLGRVVRARWLVLPGDVAAVESAEAIGLELVDEADRNVLLASSRGLGELIHEAMDAGPAELIIFLGGTATVDGGAGLLEVLGGFSVPTRAACDVRSPLLDAVHVFARQKGASDDDLGELRRRLLGISALAPFSELPGAGSAGGLGAALAALGAELVAGAQLVLDLVDFPGRLRRADLVVTGEGTVDHSTFLGKAPWAVLQQSEAAGVRCAVFGGRVTERPEGVELYELSGDPTLAREDLVSLGEALASAATGRTA